MTSPGAAAVPSGAGRARGTVAGVLVVVASLLLPVALVSVWVREQVLDTDGFVDTAGEVARDPAVQREVSDRVSTALISSLDVDGTVQGGVRSVLPDALQGLAGPLAGGADAAIRRATAAVVASDRFQALWERGVRTAHGDALRIAQGEPVAGVDTQDGRIAVDLDPVLDAVVAQLPGPIAALVPPVTTGDDIVLFRSSDLASAQPVVRAIDDGWWVAPLACVALLAGALAVGTRRRRVALWIGCGIFVSSALTFAALALARTRVLDAVAARGARAAVAVVLDALVDPLRTELWIALGVGVALAAGAIVLGLLRRPAHAITAVAGTPDDTAAAAAPLAPGVIPGAGATTATHEPVPVPPRNTGTPGIPVREPSGKPSGTD